jgi:hypothetical protein
MLFFTRKLYDGMQDFSRAGLRAERGWTKLAEVYHQYLQLIAPLLPKSVARLGKAGLHDATVVSATQKGRTLNLVVDTTHALTRLGRGQLRLTFKGVRGRVRTKRLVNAWWCYEEAHLCSRARFALHVLFHQGELEIEADELVIERLRRTGRSAKQRR